MGSKDSGQGIGTIPALDLRHAELANLETSNSPLMNSTFTTPFGRPSVRSLLRDASFFAHLQAMWLHKDASSLSSMGGNGGSPPGRI